jgi:hypothetical protein
MLRQVEPFAHGLYARARRRAQPAEWYGGAQARAIAENVLQYPSYFVAAASTPIP